MACYLGVVQSSSGPSLPGMGHHRSGVEDFPVGATVEAFGLSKAELNGLRGKVRGAKNERVEVEFDDGPKALKPCNLKLLD
eukprot:s3053_g10.t1